MSRASASALLLVLACLAIGMSIGSKIESLGPDRPLSFPFLILGLGLLILAVVAASKKGRP